MGTLRSGRLVINHGVDEVGNIVITHVKNKRMALLIDDIKQLVYDSDGQNFLGEWLYNRHMFPETGWKRKYTFDEFCYYNTIKQLKGFSKLLFWYRYRHFKQKEIT